MWVLRRQSLVRKFSRCQSLGTAPNENQTTYLSWHSSIHKQPYNLIMSTRLQKKFVLIVMDSRGSWLHRELYKYQLPHLRFKVVYRKGAGLRSLWEIVEWYLLNRQVDYVILLGGVCDITDRSYVYGIREFWPPNDLEERFNELYGYMRDIVHNFKLLPCNPDCKLAFLPEPGLDLIKYNKVPHPVPWRLLVTQAELEDRLDLLQLYTRALNSLTGAITPWSMDVTHAHRNGRLIPVYDRMTDGLHLSGNQVKKLADVIANFARIELFCPGHKNNRS